MTSAFFLRRLLLGARGPRIWWIGAKVTLVATCLQIAWIAWQTAPRLGDALLGQVHLIAYVDAGTGPDDLRGLGETLRRLPTVRDVHLVDPATALKRLQTEFASRRLNGATSASLRVEEGFLPGSVEIALKDGPNLVVDIGCAKAAAALTPREPPL